MFKTSIKETHCYLPNPYFTTKSSERFALDWTICIRPFQFHFFLLSTVTI